MVLISQFRYELMSFLRQSCPRRRNGKAESGIRIRRVRSRSTSPHYTLLIAEFHPSHCCNQSIHDGFLSLDIDSKDSDFLPEDEDDEYVPEDATAEVVGEVATSQCELDLRCNKGLQHAGRCRFPAKQIVTPVKGFLNHLVYPHRIICSLAAAPKPVKSKSSGSKSKVRKKG